MSETTISGAEFKKQLRDGVAKLGLFVNSHSATVTEQLAHSGYDWLLIDTQHGPMGNENLSAMLNDPKSAVLPAGIKRSAARTRRPRARSAAAESGFLARCSGKKMLVVGRSVRIGMRSLRIHA